MAEKAVDKVIDSQQGTFSEEQQPPQATTPSIEPSRRATPGPNAFALADRARAEHLIAGNAFAAQVKAHKLSPLTPIHPALREPTHTPAAIVRADSAPIVPKLILATPSEHHDYAEASAARSQTPSREHATVSRTTPMRSILKRLKGVSTRTRTTERAPAGHERPVQAHVDPSTPPSTRQQASSIAGAGPTPPAKDTPPVAQDSPSASSTPTYGTLEIAYPASVGDSTRQDYLSGGKLPLFDGSFQERLGRAQADISAMSSPVDTYEGSLLSPAVYQPSARSSATAAVEETLDSTLSSIVRDVVREEICKMMSTDRGALREQLGAFNIATTDMNDSEVPAIMSADTNQPPPMFTKEAELWAADLLDDRTKDQLRKLIVQQLRELYATMHEVSEAVTVHEDLLMSTIQAAKVMKTDITTLAKQTESAIRGTAKIGKQVTEMAHELSVVHKSHTELLKRFDALERRVSKSEMCEVSIKDIRSQLYALAAMVPEGFMLPDNIRKYNEDMRQDLLKRAQQHPQLTTSITNALPGEFGHLAWVTDVVRSFLPRLEKLDMKLEAVMRWRREYYRDHPAIIAARQAQSIIRNEARHMPELVVPQFSVPGAPRAATVEDEADSTA